MTLKIGWSHDPENLSATPAGGPMTLKTGGPFRLKISARRWSLHGENRQVEAAEGLLCSDEKNAICLLSAHDLKTRKARSFADVAQLEAVRPNKQGTHIVFGFRDKNHEPHVRIWDLDSGNTVTLPGKSETPFFVNDTIVVREEDHLVWFGVDGVEQQRVALSTLVQDQHVRVEATDQNSLLLLSQNRIVIIDASSGNLVRGSDSICPRPLRAILHDETVVYTTEGGRVRWL